MASLYEIKNEYLDILNNLTVNEDGEIVGIEALEQAEGELEDKIKACVFFAKEQDALAEAIEKEKKSFDERLKAVQKRNEKFKEQIAWTLRESGMITDKKKKYETAEFALSTRPSESVEVNEKVLDQKWKNESVKFTWTADKAKIKEALVNGELIEGAKLIKKQNLQIK